MALLVLRRVGLRVGQKPNVPFVRWQKLFLKNVRWEKIKIQKRWLLGRLSECSLFLSLFSVSFCRSFLLGSFFRLAGNGFGLCVRADFEALNCLPALNLNRSTKSQVCTSPRLTQNPCYRQVLLSR